MRSSYDSTNAIPHLMSNQLLPNRQVSQSIMSPDSNFKCHSNNSYSTFPHSRRTQSKEKQDSFLYDANLTESQIGTCNGSMQSLTNEVPTNWRSNITTNKNSANHSPASPSDLPDSPSNLFLDNADDFDDESCILAEAIEAAMPKPRQIKSNPVSLLTRSDSIDG